MFTVTTRMIFALQGATAWGTLMFRESVVRGGHKAVSRNQVHLCLFWIALKTQQLWGHSFFQVFKRREPRFLCLPPGQIGSPKCRLQLLQCGLTSTETLLGVGSPGRSPLLSLVTTPEVWDICIAMLSVFLWQEVFHLQMHAFKFSTFVPLSL